MVPLEVTELLDWEEEIISTKGEFDRKRTVDVRTCENHNIFNGDKRSINDQWIR